MEEEEKENEKEEKKKKGKEKERIARVKRKLCNIYQRENTDCVSRLEVQNVSVRRRGKKQETV